MLFLPFRIRVLLICTVCAGGLTTGHLDSGAVEMQPETVRLVGHSESRAWQQSGESAQQSTAVELDVNVEYTAGCHRSHAARIAVPVTGPLRCLIWPSTERSSPEHGQLLGDWRHFAAMCCAIVKQAANYEKLHVQG